MSSQMIVTKKTRSFSQIYQERAFEKKLHNMTKTRCFLFYFGPPPSANLMIPGTPGYAVSI